MSTNRYHVVFSINEKTIGEEYLGDFNITDKLTNEMYQFPLRGEENTFAHEFTKNDEIGDTCVWVESFGKTFNPQKCKDSEELAEYIDDYKDGINMRDFVSSFEDLDRVNQVILKHYYTAISEPIILSGIDETFIANREIGKLLVKSVETGLSSHEIQSFSRDFRPMTKELHRLLNLTKAKNKNLEMER